MTDKTDDAGVIAAVLARLNQYRLPRLLDLKARVDDGATVTENDLQFLERVMQDARAIQPVVDRNPAVQPLYSQVIALYAEITEKALANEKKS